MKRIRDIENHLERADAELERFSKIEAVREKKEKQKRIIKICLSLLIILCSLYAIFSG